jgi:hypothetical protein
MCSTNAQKRKELDMTDDPNKKQHNPDPHQSSHQRDQGVEDISKKRPSHDNQSENEEEQLKQQQERQRQRQVS